MKKILIAIALTCLTPTTFAALNLSGSVSDANGALKKVKVTLDIGNPAIFETSILDGYEFEDLNELPTALTFEKEGYESITKPIEVIPAQMEETEYFVTFDGNEIEEGQNGGFNLGDTKMMLKPEPLVPIITGTVYTNDDKPLPGVTVSGYYKTTDSISISIKTKNTKASNDTGAFVVNGYDDPNIAKYHLTFSSKLYEDKDVVLNAGETDGIKVIMTQKKGGALREETRTAMTGFGCNELMPKYLVGASCEANKDLDGDATDIARWIQKFGSQITSIITMLAVALIVWNAFQIVTAAGDSEQIAQGKKGILCAFGLSLRL